MQHADNTYQNRFNQTIEYEDRPKQIVKWSDSINRNRKRSMTTHWHYSLRLNCFNYREKRNTTAQFHESIDKLQQRNAVIDKFVRLVCHWRSTLSTYDFHDCLVKIYGEFKRNMMAATILYEIREHQSASVCIRCRVMTYQRCHVLRPGQI